jgi:hypothetical protein
MSARARLLGLALHASMHVSLRKMRKETLTVQSQEISSRPSVAPLLTRVCTRTLPFF